MPKVDLTYTDLSKYPQHCIAITRIVTTFSMLEATLAHVFAWCMGCAPFHASAAYYSIQNFNARLQMIRSLREYLHTQDEKDGLEDIINLANDVASVRNQFAHGLWSDGDSNPYLHTGLKGRWPEGSKRPVPLEEIREAANSSSQSLTKVIEKFNYLQSQRTLTVNRETVKPSLREKWKLRPQSPRADHNPRRDNIEEP